MANLEYNINELLRIAFGYVALPYPLGNLTLPSLQSFETSLVKFGTAYASKSDVLGRSLFMPVWLNDVELPNPIISVQLQKRIVSTPVAGRKGTVKELISTEDYRIKLKGIAIADTYPTDAVEQLIRLFEIEKPVNINNDITAILGITKCVIENLQLGEIAGKQNIQTYEMDLISDDDFTAILL
jgi:hypothetical protein